MTVARINTTTYPNVDTYDIGSLPNIGYGTPKNVRCHCIVGGATTRPTADITAVATSFTVEDISRYPAAPFTIQIGEERMRVTALTVATKTFDTVTRAYDNTLAVAHKKKDTVFEVLTEYVYLVANHAVKSIDKAYIDEQEQDDVNDSRITFYTGQAGDAHTDWPGVATIAFAADAYIGKQYNTEDASDKEAGQQVDGVVNIGVSQNLYDGLSTTMTIGESAPTVAWVEFATQAGTIKVQEYSVAVENASATDIATGYISVSGADGVTDNVKPFSIPISTSETLTIAVEGGDHNDKLAISCGVGSINVSAMSKITTIRDEQFTRAADYATIDPAPVIEYLVDAAPVKFVTYPTTALGTEVISETHRASITVASGDTSSVRIAAVDPTGNTAYAFKDYVDLEAGTYALAINYSGGDWDTVTKVIELQGDGVTCSSMSKTLEYATLITDSADSLAASSSARIVVGDDITVNAQWSVDTAGDYAGVGTLIERPDHVIEDFLRTHLGFTSGEIDATTFNASGALYAAAISGGYKFSFIWDGNTLPQDMAYECRSTIRYVNGKWELVFTPDTAPTEDKTIDSGDIVAGTQFIFNETPLIDVANDLKARFGPRGFGEWTGTVTASDIPTGEISYPKDIDFRLINIEAMAQDVLDHILLETKTIFLEVEFSTFWRNFDLNVGDTIKITNDLFNNTKYFIESRSRDKSKARFRAKGWW